jgi:4a-hydroxytetrahydrobiopterin dehydratase
MLLAMGTLGASEVNQRLSALPGWALEGAAIRRKFTFSGFADAVAFLVRLGFEAEAADHHPDILVNYKRVTLTYSTHSEGGLTEKDFAGATRATELATSFGGS